MHDRSALGPADVTDEQLTAMVADLLGSDLQETEALCSSATEFPYALPSITTAGRYLVNGTALVARNETPFRMFVKHIQAWERHPFFQAVPPEFRQLAATGVPWRTEALAYRSDLADRLPDGLTMPRAVGVFDLDETSTAVWLEEVPVVERAWDLARYGRAAHLLGRLAASPEVEVRRDVGEFGWEVGMYFHGRLSVQVLPMLRDGGIWRHPLVAGAFDADLRSRLLEAADNASAYNDELCAMPVVTGHGDACPNNLLRRDGTDDFVLIDYGFWGPHSIGHDLGQLLVGDVQVGRRGSGDLAEIDDAICTGYLAGLRAEGCEVPADVVRRAHALQLLIFTGLSTLPFEHLDSAPSPELHAMAAARAAIARFSLDLVEATGG